MLNEIIPKKERSVKFYFYKILENANTTFNGYLGTGKNNSMNSVSQLPNFKNGEIMAQRDDAIALNIYPKESKNCIN